MSLWRTSGTAGQFLPTNTGTEGAGNLQWVSTSGAPLFSDAVAITNDSVIAIGSGAVGTTGENTTYVDILALTYPGGTPQASIRQSHVLGGGSGLGQVAGYAHDVAVTPDGARAVVSHQNWIHVFDMASGAAIGSINIGAGDSPSGAGPCWPGNSRNSVAVTNTRAVVTAMRFDPEPPPTGGFEAHTWVYVIDLGTTSDPDVLLEHKLDPSPSTTHDQYPHDLAITPDGQLAVVTTDGAIGLYGLAGTPAYLGGYFNSNEKRRWPQLQELWDSVEVSNTHAVVVSNQIAGGGPRWSVRVFSIGTGALLPVGNDLILPSNVGAGAAWDVALSDDGVVAGIKTQIQDVVLLDVPGTGVGSYFYAGPGSLQHLSSSGSPPHNDGVVVFTRTGYDPVQRWVAFAGWEPWQQQRRARLLFYDHESGTVAPMPTLADSSSLLSVCDMALGPGNNQAILRLSAQDLDSGQSGGLDWSRFAGSPPTEVTPSFGANGVYAGADSLVVRRNAAVSTSWDPNSPTPAGWIHVVTVQ